MRIEYSGLAVEDLTNILDTIAEESKPRALKYVGKLRETIELLASFPNLGVSCKSRGLEEACRVMVFEKYLIFYTTSPDVVVIKTIIHTAKNNK